MDIAEYLRTSRGIDLNAAQVRAVTGEEKYTLVLAVPGSGKTTVLTARLAHRIHNRGVPPSRMLNLTFNRDTAEEMRRRYEVLFGSGEEEPAKLPRFQTLHAFCLTVLREYARQTGKPLPHLLGGADGAVLRRLYREQTGEFLTDDRLELLQNRLGYLRNRMLPLAQAACPEIPGFADIAARYASWKRERRQMDFDDLLTGALRVLERCPTVLRRFRDRYDEISLDEAQDTSTVQFAVLRLLIDPTDGRIRTFWVGDEDQSVYGFRGACPEELLRFPSEYPGACVIKMEQNYRSGTAIVDAANRLIRYNRNRYDKRMTAGERPAGIERIRLADGADQPEQVAALLAELPAGRSAGVLYRNNTSAIALANGLLRAGIPFQVREHVLSWFSGTVMEDLAAYVQLADDPGDVRAFGRIFRKLGYSRGIAEWVGQNARAAGGVFPCILELPSVRGRQREQTLEYAERFGELLRLPAGQALDRICEDLGYRGFLEGHAGTWPLRQEWAAACSIAEGASDLYDFFARTDALRTELEQQSPDLPPVLLSTFHSAKGMEFDWVILTDLLDGIVPPEGAAEEPDGMESERRLFYVGVTRARSRLILLDARRFCGEPAAASPFLAQLQKPPKEKTDPCGR